MACTSYEAMYAIERNPFLVDTPAAFRFCSKPTQDPEKYQPKRCRGLSPPSRIKPAVAD